jgi:hypothetical protein
MERGPLVQTRAAQPYVGISAEVTTEDELRAAVHRGFAELFGWLGDNGIQPSGAPFIRYLEVAEDGRPLRLELAAPIRAAVSGAGSVHADELPAGSYVTLLHVGPYRSLKAPDLGDARAELLAWARARGLDFDAHVEHYITDARSEPDWTRWETELAYLIAAA